MEMFKEHISEKLEIPISDNIEDNIFSPNISEIENKKKKDKITIDRVPEYSISKHDRKNVIENSQFCHFKNFNEEFKKNIKFDKNYSTNYKNSNHFKICNSKSLLNDKDSQSSISKHDFYDNNHEFEYRERENSRFEMQNGKLKKNDFVNKNQNYIDSYHHKYDRRKSNENKYNEKSRWTFETEIDNKSTKYDKKKEENYFHCKNERKYNSSSHYYSKYNKNQIHDY
jgi:hypothetical protein